MVQFADEGPRCFYKYKHIDEAHLDYSRRIFTHNELYFSTADDFNDPSDCSYRLVINGSEANPEYKQMKVGPKWGIYCLSAVVPDHTLMWPHYADGHRGFCLEFSNDPNDQFYAKRKPNDPDFLFHPCILPLDVQYSAEYPIINPHSDDYTYAGVVRNAFFTKATQWKHEKEWRILDDNGPGTHQFPSRFLTGVIFGCKMSEDHKDRIRGWCKDRQPPIKYYQAQQVAGDYALKICDLP